MKTIIYLDQNYLSNLTKARLKGNDHPNYRQLYDLLCEAVHANAIVCPASPSHYNESQMDSRVEDFYGTLEELYCGVEFHYFEQIVHAQATAALYRHLGIPQPPQPDWKAAFKSNPHSPFDGKIGRINRSGHALLIEQLRLTKANYEKEPNPVPIGNLEAQKRHEAREFIRFFYPLPNPELSIDSLGELESVLSNLLEHKPTWEEKDKFLRSEQLMAAPFIDIYASLRAAMICWNRTRKPHGSDLEDVMAESTALPYCDVYATDGFMKDLIGQLKLDQKYAAKVFSAQEGDVLALTSSVRDILSK